MIARDTDSAITVHEEREHMRSRIAIITISIILALALGSGPVGAASEGELVIALPDYGNQVPVPWQEFAFGKSYMRLIYTALVGITDDGDLSAESGAATKWEASEDKKTWTFTLRDNIKFHNGDILTSDDVQFSLHKMFSPQSVASYVGRLRQQISSIKTDGPNKVIITTKDPAPFLPWELSDIQGTEGMLQPKAYTEQVGDEGFTAKPVGSGPYQVVERKHGDYIKLQAVENHWHLGTPKYKTIVLKKVPEESTRIAMLKTGEADVISVSRERAPEVKAEGMNVFVKSRWSILGVYFHEQWREEVPISKLKVRQALSHAINREELAQYVFAGSAVPASVFPIPSRAPGAAPELKPHEYDPDKAKALLKEAGYPDGFEVTVYSFPRADVPEMGRFIEAMAGYFAEVGVTAKIVPTEYASYRKKRLGFDLPGAMGALAAPNRPLAGMVSLMRVLVHSEGRFTSIKDPALDKLVVEAEQGATDAAAEAALQKIYRHMYENVNHLTVVEMDLPYATSAEIKEWNLGGAVWDQNFIGLVRP